MSLPNRILGTDNKLYKIHVSELLKQLIFGRIQHNLDTSDRCSEGRYYWFSDCSVDCRSLDWILRALISLQRPEVES